MDKQRLCAIASEFGTPSFVFDTQALAARMRAVKEIVGSSVHLCYSIKANPFLIPAMQDLVELLEVCSPGELEICESLNVDPKTILFSGVNKTLADIEHAMDAGVVRFTAESPLHIRLLEQEFSVTVVNREGELRVEGEPEDTMLACKAIYLA